ncbi:MAG TPA: EAL domain-containing protein [Anaeromyxobacteraceae bacterium]|nr:EAL domain-containing protein [Anaeromyxobacteraceae bacterium]
MNGAKWLIGRQPILDREERVYAYELLFRGSHVNRADVPEPSLATASVILGVLSGFGMRQVLGIHPGFINVGRDFLFSDAIELAPPERTVLEILETIEPTRSVIERCRHLKESGFRLALDDHQFRPEFESLYPLVEFVKIDVSITDPDELATTLRQLGSYPFRLIAEKVESREQFHHCVELGFHHFQGYYFARPSILERRRLGDAESVVLHVLRLLAADANIDEIEGALRQGPTLVYKLLVLLNSVAFALRERVTTLRHAIAMLGRRQMQRWLQLALFASDDDRGLDNPVLDLAAVRASFMEQLARRLPAEASPPDGPEKAFMVGILSLMSAVYDVSVDELVRTLNLANEVSSALLSRQGVLGELLLAVEHVERGDHEGARPGIERLGVPWQQVMEAQWVAFAWRTGPA